jgi:sugar phosphate isomerase/epimerase
MALTININKKGGMMKANNQQRGNKLTRRDALKITAAGALAAAAPMGVLHAAKKKVIPVGVQLYSVRNDCKKDFNKALAKIAKLGFDGVEFAGYHQYGKDPKGLKKVLDDLGLKAAGTHIGANSFEAGKIQKTIDFHKAIGCTLLIVPGDGRFSHPEKSKQYAEIHTKAVDKLKAVGMASGHHNHTSEFKDAGNGKTYWDLFAERTPKEVVLQQDVGWTVVAGKDPVMYVRKYPGRTLTSHFKAKLPKGTKGKKPFIGQDTIDWRALITACYEVGGTQWMTVEQEDYPDGKSPMECIEISLNGLRKILGEMDH